MYVQNRETTLESIITDYLQKKGYINPKNVRELEVVRLLFEGAVVEEVARDLSGRNEFLAYILLANKGYDDNQIEKLLGTKAAKTARKTITDSGLEIKELRKYRDPKRFMGENVTLLKDTKTPETVRDSLLEENISLSRAAEIWAVWVNDAEELVEDEYYTSSQVPTSNSNFTLNISIPEVSPDSITLNESDRAFASQVRARIVDEHLSIFKGEVEGLVSKTRQFERIRSIPSKLVGQFLFELEESIVSGMRRLKAEFSQALAVEVQNSLLTLRAFSEYVGSIKKSGLGRICFPPESLHEDVGAGKFHLSSKNRLSLAAFTEERPQVPEGVSGLPFLGILAVERLVYLELKEKKVVDFLKILDASKKPLAALPQDTALCAAYLTDELKTTTEFIPYLTEPSRLEAKLLEIRKQAEDFVASKPRLSPEALAAIAALGKLYDTLPGIRSSEAELLFSLRKARLTFPKGLGPYWEYLDEAKLRRLQEIVFNSYLFTTTREYLESVTQRFLGHEADASELFTSQLGILERLYNDLGKRHRNRFNTVFVRCSRSGRIRYSDRAIPALVDRIMKTPMHTAGGAQPVSLGDLRLLVKLNQKLFCFYTPLHLKSVHGKGVGPLATESAPGWRSVQRVLLERYLKKLSKA